MTTISKSSRVSRRRLAGVAVALGLWLVQNDGQAQPAPDLAIVANPSIGNQTLTSDDVEAIFRGAMKKWSNGETVISLNLPARSPLREEFDKVLLGMNAEQASKFWIDQRIRGVARPPKQVEDPAFMAKVLVNLKGSVGYIPSSLVTSGMRVIGHIRNGRIEMEKLASNG